jgi:hypothetical protein
VCCEELGTVVASEDIEGDVVSLPSCMHNSTKSFDICHKAEASTEMVTV